MSKIKNIHWPDVTPWTPFRPGKGPVLDAVLAASEGGAALLTLDPEAICQTADHVARQAVRASRARLDAARGTMPGLQPRYLVPTDGGRLEAMTAEERQAEPATPQTRRKLRASVIDRLHRQGALSDLHVRAAEEIESVWMALGRSLQPRGSTYEARVSGGGWREPLERLSAREYEALTRRYGPWVRDLQAAPIRYESSRQKVIYSCASGIAVAVAVHNAGLSEIEHECRFPRDKGHVQMILRIALDRYSWLAGWHRGEKIEVFSAFPKGG